MDVHEVKSDNRNEAKQCLLNENWIKITFVFGVHEYRMYRAWLSDDEASMQMTTPGRPE